MKWITSLDKKQKSKWETIQIIQSLKYIRTNSSEEVHIEVGKENGKLNGRKINQNWKVVHMYTSPALPVTHGKQDGSASRYGRNS